MGSINGPLGTFNVKTQSMRNGSFNKILKCQLKYFCARFHSREINPIVIYDFVKYSCDNFGQDSF